MITTEQRTDISREAMTVIAEFVKGQIVKYEITDTDDILYVLSMVSKATDGLQWSIKVHRKSMKKPHSGDNS